MTDVTQVLIMSKIHSANLSSEVKALRPPRSIIFWNADKADFQTRMYADFCLSCYYQSVFIRVACIRVIRVLIFSLQTLR